MTDVWLRKDQHVHLAEMQYQTESLAGLDGIRLIHHSFSSLTLDDIQLTTQIGSLTLEVPFFINAMTGGSPKTKIINQNLALIAKETKVAMAVGSVSTALKHPELTDSFKIVRQVNPDGIIFANLGAHHSLENAKKAVDLLKANALQIHLNTPQELVMPEGDRDFRSWLTNIEAMVKYLDVPVIVKEVGFGMSQQTIQQLIDIGVTIIDVAGKGGTNFIQIENSRREQPTFDYLYDWGQTTAESLLEAHSFQQQVDFIASGGLRHPLDFLKCFTLGAKAVGLSGEVLHQVLTQGNEATIDSLNRWQNELKKLMLLTNISTIKEATNLDFILSKELTHYCEQRQINMTKKRLK